MDSIRHDQVTSPKIKSEIPTESCYVRAGRTEVERVISNLISNAIKYTPADGLIEIKVEKANEMLAFSISNSGAPIPESELPQLFNKFSRVSTSKGKPGTGLGLYIVKRILEALGGNIEISSNTKEGTKATAIFPMINS